MFDHKRPSQCGVVIVDECLHVKLWNPWMERVSGVDGYRAMGRNLADLMPGMRASGLESHILDAIYTGRSAKVQAHEVSDMAWAHDLWISIKPANRETTASISAAQGVPVALCAIEFEAFGRTVAQQHKPQDTHQDFAMAPRKTPTALLLESDPLLRQEMAACLQAEGYNVCEAEDGVAAVRIVQLSETFDLIFADICNPILGGFDAVMQIRSLPSVKGNIPAIALVTNGSFHDRDRLLNAGFSDYFIKSEFENCLPRFCRNIAGVGQGVAGGEIFHV